MSTQKTTNSAKKSVQTEPSPTRKNELTTSTQKYAQMINFQELQRILQQKAYRAFLMESGYTALLF